MPIGNVDELMSSATVSSSATDASDRKAALFCQQCDHASPVDGDWVVHTVGDHRRLRCPECRTVVDERHAPEATAETPVQRYVDAWGRYWSAWTSLLAPNADC
jgi:uncharacterized Zn finger protein